MQGTVLSMIVFLGSGVSLASGLPSVTTLTDDLLEDKGDQRLTQLYRLLRDIDEEYLRESAPFKRHDGSYGYMGQLYREATTYEDIFYLLDQIDTNGVGLKADPTIQTFADLVRRKGSGFLKGRTSIQRAVDLHQLAMKGRRTILDIVSSKLLASQVRGLDTIVELARSPAVARLVIATLNHDTLVEQLLIQNSIPFTDGFDRDDGDVSLYTGHFPSAIKVHIMKLHGSINWWNCDAEYTVRPRDFSRNDLLHCLYGSGKPVSVDSPSPSFLTGVGKVNSYSQGIYNDQHYQFQRSLREHDLMVMSGYGWKDLAINFQLQNWLWRHCKAKLLLLHESPQELQLGSLELSHIYGKYTQLNRIISVNKWLSDTGGNEVLELLAGDR